MVGTYLMIDSLFSGGVYDSHIQYVLQVTKGDTKKDTLYFNNFLNSGGAVPALVAGTNFSLLLASSSLQGYGNVSGNSISCTIIESMSVAVKSSGTKY